MKFTLNKYLIFKNNTKYFLDNIKFPPVEDWTDEEIKDFFESKGIFLFLIGTKIELVEPKEKIFNKLPEQYKLLSIEEVFRTIKDDNELKDKELFSFSIDGKFILKIPIMFLNIS